MRQNLKNKVGITLILLIAILSAISCSSSNLIQETSVPIKNEPTIVASTDAEIEKTEAIELVIDNSIWFDQGIPELFMVEVLENNPKLTIENEELAEISVSLEPEENLIGEWLYVLAAPFPTLKDNIQFEDLIHFWQGTSINMPFQYLLLSEDTYHTLVHLLGEENNPNIIITEPDKLLTSTWDNAQITWAILPFQDLNPKWKIISIDQQKPTSPRFVTEDYNLNVEIYSNGIDDLSENGISSNFQKDKITTVNMTGVTALVRATAVLMEKYGTQYPAEEIKSILAEADYTHISNEVSFAVDCPHPQYEMEILQFCSSPDYIELLIDIDADIIEFTGDHLEDWGIDAIYYTLDLYLQNNMAVYGAGNNLAEAKQPLIINHNGNQIAFLGCNAKSPSYAHAAEHYPGTWFCDFDELSRTIQQLSSEGINTIVTIQHKEVDQFIPTAEIIGDFAKLADAGATVVIGSQAHQPQTMTFQENTFIHYGLGNLFFDQYNESEANRLSFIDRLVFYENRLVSVELFANQFVDWAKSRPMTVEEKEEFLSMMFELSGWGEK
ncbi:MAG: CapA family protein [Anaerolineaceae bacterium]|nr:CapA family protein [Anaerolineaceae bacterium]